MNARTTTRRMAAAVVAVAAVVAGGAETAQAADTLKRERYMLVRTTDGPASFQISAGGSPGDGVDAFAGVIGARVEDGEAKAVFPGTHATYGRTDSTTVYGLGDEPTTACELGGPCTVLTTLGGGVQTYLSDDGGKDVPNRVYVVIEAAYIDFAVEAKGWELRPADFDYRYVDNLESDAIGASQNSRGVEVFFESTAPGGANGSVAQANPPCTRSVVNQVSRGVGRMTLDGGPSSPTFTCPLDTDLIGDFARGATTWRAHGYIAGQNDLANTHLFVVDLPKHGGPPAAEPEQAPAGSSAPAPAAGTPAVERGGRESVSPGPAGSAPIARAALPAPCTRTVTARRSRRVVTVRTRGAATCRVSFRLVAGRKVLSRGSARVRSGRAVTTRLRLGRSAARPSGLVIVATDAAGNRTSRTIAVR